MKRAERADRLRATTLRTIRRVYRRDVVTVREIYRTRRKNEPVGEATLTCGHLALVDMVRPAKWRICWTCWKEKRAVVAAPATTGEEPTT